MGFNTNKIRGLMAERRMTQKELSKKLSISLKSLSRKLLGQSDFTSSEIVSLASVFEVEPNIFFTTTIPSEAKSIEKQ